MRYNVHSPCAFHSRIAKSLGVLVAAALVATLGLPSAAQAQTPAAPTVTGMGDGAPRASTAPPPLLQRGGSRLVDGSGQDQWLLEYTEPGVAWDDATEVKVEIEGGTKDFRCLPADDPRIHHGVWRFRVSYYDAESPNTDTRQSTEPCPSGHRHGERHNGLPARSADRRPDGLRRLSRRARRPPARLG